MLKKVWNDPVWSKVIAGIILACGAGFGTYFLWPNIGHIFKLNEKTVSDSERHTELREPNSEVPKTTEPSVSKAKQQARPPTSIKRPGREKTSSTRVEANLPVIPSTQAETKQPAVEKPCEQSTVGLKRQPRIFTPAWHSILERLRNERTTYDLRNLFEVWGRIPVGLTGKDLIQEAIYTLSCQEETGVTSLEKLGSTSRYWGEDFDNQRIVFKSQ
jgi:hypothetical protein